MNVHPRNVVPLDVTAVARRNKARERHLNHGDSITKRFHITSTRAHREVISQGEQLSTLVSQIVDKLRVFAVP